ncbi:MAG TPA: META domain-containing protein [Candidatus Paceibacterota bacterium]|nr:META domain-containing protein [Candidatus Paceibacterota bacterium]
MAKSFDKRFIVGLVAAVILLSGALYAWNKPPSGIADQLEGKTFHLAMYKGASVADGSNYTLSFQDGKLSAKFCNNMSGNYTLANSSLQGKLASTLKYCQTPAGLMDIENVFGAGIDKGLNVSYQGDTLKLTTAENVQFVFTK